MTIMLNVAAGNFVDGMSSRRGSIGEVHSLGLKRDSCASCSQSFFSDSLTVLGTSILVSTMMSPLAPSRCGNPRPRTRREKSAAQGELLPRAGFRRGKSDCDPGLQNPDVWQDAHAGKDHRLYLRPSRLRRGQGCEDAGLQ